MLDLLTTNLSRLIYRTCPRHLQNRTKNAPGEPDPRYVSTPPPRWSERILPFRSRRVLGFFLTEAVIVPLCLRSSSMHESLSVIQKEGHLAALKVLSPYTVASDYHVPHDHGELVLMSSARMTVELALVLGRLARLSGSHPLGRSLGGLWITYVGPEGEGRESRWWLCMN
ncbi:hypothetical protein GGG16DRAFT_59299 [Schizophyllum commune]